MNAQSIGKPWSKDFLAARQESRERRKNPFRLGKSACCGVLFIWGPRRSAWNPSSHVLAVVLVLIAKLLPQDRLFIEHDKEIYSHDGSDRIGCQARGEFCEQYRRAGKNKPGAEVHRIAHVAIRSSDHEQPRRVKRCWSTSSGKDKSGEAIEYKRQAEKEGNDSQPSGGSFRRQAD